MKGLGAALLAAALVGCSTAPPAGPDRLRPCSSAEGPTDAFCGELRVFEDRERRQGRTIDLKIVILPALSNDPRPDPLVFLAGGPGQGAAQMARLLRDPLRRVQTERDIVLVDQRGTGKSNPLNCDTDQDSLQGLNETTEAALARLLACLKGLNADPRLYTTPIAMDDLDDVRAFLGYERVNLYGGSYGTRAALVYLRQHGERVRSVILDGVAPPGMRLPLYFARDAQRAFDKLVADCEADPICAGKYPRLAERTRALVSRLDASPVRTRLVHPRTGIGEEVTVNAEFVASIIFSALYVPIAAALVPELVVRAEANDFQAMLALALLNESVGQNMAFGMQLSVVCAEDHPRITDDDRRRAAEGTLFGQHLLRLWIKACEIWPRGTVPASYDDPVVSDLPVLIMSGDLDPVTPPEWGESVLPHLRNARHVVVPGAGHGTLTTPCGGRIVREFLAEGSPHDLDVSCTQALKRPPFFVTPAGPDPAARRAAGEPR